MSNTNAEPASAQKPAEGTPSPEINANGQGAEKPEFLTKAAVDELLTTQRNSIFAELRRQGKLEKEKPAESGKEPLLPAKDAKDPRVDALLAKHSKSLKQAAFAEAISSVGVTGDDADLLKSAIEGKYGAVLKVDTESDEVYFEADDGSRRSIKDVTQDFFKKHGDRFKPAKNAPTGSGMGGGEGSKGSSGPHPFSSLTYEQIMQHKNVELRSSFIRDNSDAFLQKKRTAGR